MAAKLRSIAFGSIAIACAAALSAVSAAVAGDWPEKPIHLVVPFVPGGATDVVARLYADPLAARLGQPVLVDNRPGGGANLGAALVAKSAPDGYTLFVGSSPGFVNALALSKDAGFDPARDFTAVVQLARQSFLLTLHPSLPPSSLAEFVAYAKARPGALSYATPGIGTPHHLAMELFKRMAGIDLVHVPYRGGAPMTVDVLAGQVGTMFASYVIVGQHMKSGKLKAVAASGSRRVPQMPDIATIAEQGYPDYDVETWHALVAPTGTPVAVIERIAREVQAIQQLPETGERLMLAGYESPDPLTVAQLSAKMARDIVRWSKVVTDAGMKPE